MKEFDKSMISQSSCGPHEMRLAQRFMPMTPKKQIHRHRAWDLLNISRLLQLVGQYRSNREEFRNSKAVISQQPEMGEPPNFAHILPRGLPAPHKILKFF